MWNEPVHLWSCGGWKPRCLVLSGSGPAKARDLIVWCFLVPPEMEAYCLCLLTFACDVIVVGHSKLILLEVWGVLESTGQYPSIPKPSSIISPMPRHLKPTLCIVWPVWWHPPDSGLCLSSPWFSLCYWNAIVSTDIYSKSLMFIFRLLQLLSGCTNEVFILEYSILSMKEWETGSHYIAQDGAELAFLLPQPPTAGTETKSTSDFSI